MSIKAQCGQCQASFGVRDEFAGKRVKCPKCSQPMTIPNKADAPSAQARTAQASGAAKGAAGLSPVLPHEAKPQPRPVGGAAKPMAQPKPVSAPAQRAAAAPMFVGAAGASVDSRSATRPTAGASNSYNPLLDLLDEAQVAARPRGLSCQNCGAEVQPNAIICVECGYNLETGEQLETAVLIGDEELLGSSRMSDAEKILAKAEKEIAERPVTAVGQDFGDGNESILISLVAGGAFVAFIGLGVATVLSLDWFMEKFELTPAMISIAAASTIYALGMIWISIVAFTVHPGQGIACLCSGGTYCMIYGFMQGKGTILPAILMIAALLIGGLSYALSGSGQPDYSWISSDCWMCLFDSPQHLGVNPAHPISA